MRRGFCFGGDEELGVEIAVGLEGVGVEELDGDGERWDGGGDGGGEDGGGGALAEEMGRGEGGGGAAESRVCEPDRFARTGL